MQTITYTNAGGYGATLGMNRPFIQGHIDGLSWPGAELVLTPAAGLDGALDRGARLLPRVVSVSGTLCSDEGRAGLYRLREELSRAMNPSVSGYLTYTNDHASRGIAARPLGEPEWGARRGETLPFTVRFSCPSPWWEDIQETVLELGHGAGGLRFPLGLPTRFTQVWPERAINNAGHAETPVRISFGGPAVNPAVENVTTGQRIRIERTLGDGDALRIDTDRRSMGVVIRFDGGAEEDATNSLSLDSSMLTLAPGANLLRYSTDNDAGGNKLTIAFRKRYAGV